MRLYSATSIRNFHHQDSAPSIKLTFHFPASTDPLFVSPSQHLYFRLFAQNTTPIHARLLNIRKCIFLFHKRSNDAVIDLTNNAIAFFDVVLVLSYSNYIIIFKLRTYDLPRYFPLSPRGEIVFITYCCYFAFWKQNAACSMCLAAPATGGLRQVQPLCRSRLYQAGRGTAVSGREPAEPSVLRRKAE